MKPTDAIKVLSEIRDLQIVDSEGTFCGIADDIEFEGKPGEALAVSAILVGPGALLPRFPFWFRPVVRLLVGNRMVRVPWSAVESITSMIALKSRAAEMRLGTVDRRLRIRFPKWGAL